MFRTTISLFLLGLFIVVGGCTTDFNGFGNETLNRSNATDTNNTETIISLPEENTSTIEEEPVMNETPVDIITQETEENETNITGIVENITGASENESALQVFVTIEGSVYTPDNITVTRGT